MYMCPRAFCGEGSIVHGFLWHNGVMTDLGAIAGNEYDSVANSVNDSHEIVGWTSTIPKVTGQNLRRAFVYVNGTMYNLKGFGLILRPNNRPVESLGLRK
jgi:probable HAF family extracellular repeat protein